MSFSFFFLINVFSYEWKRLKIKNQYQQDKNRARRAKVEQKINTFGQFDTRDLVILLVRNRILDFFEVFLELCRKCWVFAPLKGLYLVFLKSKG